MREDVPNIVTAVVNTLPQSGSNTLPPPQVEERTTRKSGHHMSESDQEPNHHQDSSDSEESSDDENADNKDFGKRKCIQLSNNIVCGCDTR